MALVKKKEQSTQRINKLNWAMGCLLSISFTGSAIAQTIVIGGSDAPAVTVDMSSAYGSTVYALAPRTSPLQGNSPSNQGIDYTKSAEIKYGNEVIKLVPPGSQPKKSKPVAERTTRPAKKTIAPAPNPVVAITAKARPEASKPVKTAKSVAKPAPKLAATAEAKQKIATKKVAKKYGPTPAAPLKKQAPPVKVAKKDIPAPSKMIDKVIPTAGKKIAAALSPEKSTMPPSKSPAVTIKAEMAAPAPIVDTKTKKTSTPKAITPQITKKITPAEIKVAAVDPKQLEKPVARIKKIPAITPDAPANLEQIFFEKDATKLPSSAVSPLKEMVKAISGSNDRIQLVAYADASSNGAARRLSLGRALVIRSKLMELGVPNNKIEVRALGRPSDGTPADRVDLKLVAR